MLSELKIFTGNSNPELAREICADLGLPPLDATHDRAMLCGSPAMLTDLSDLLDARGFKVSPHIGAPGDYVIERAFVEK